MATQVQWKRGTTAQNNTYTGAIGEITVDTTLKQLRLHDGATAGGTTIGSSSVSTATNIAGGTAGQIPYQTAAGATGFFGAGTAGTVLVSYGSAGTPTFQNTLTLAGTTAASSTQTGALVVGGGVGIGGNLYVGGDIIANKLTIQLTTVTTTLIQTDDVIQTLNTTQSNSTITGALQVAGGAGIGLDITVGGSIRVGSVVTATTFVGNLTGNITGAGTGNLVYQSAANTTSFLSTGTSGQLLVAAGGAPAWTNTSSIYVNRSTLADTATNAATAYATIGTLSTGTGFYGGSFNGSANQTLTLNTATLMTTAVNIVGGLAGSLPYQTAAGTTTMLGLGTSGYVLTAGASAPAWSAISGLSAGNATTATNLANGTAGQIPYQSAPGATSFISTSTTGNFLQANYVGAPTWTTTASMYVANAVASTNLRAGTAGQLHYQSAADASGFISTATTGNFLQANYVGAPTWTTTASMYVANAVTATSAATANSTIASLSTGTGFYGGTFNGSTAQTWSLNTTTLIANAVTSINIANGTTGQLVYQSGAGTTGFVGPGTFGQFLMSTGASAPVYQSTLTQAGGNIIVTSNTAVSSTNSGALQIINGGLGVGGGGFFGGIVTATTYYGTFAGTIGGTTTINTASNIANGTAGQLHYQTAPGLTGFVNTSTPGNFLQANYVGAPTWTSTSTMQVGYAANILGAGTGNIHIQSANNTTALLSTGTAGQLLMAAGGAPVFTNTSSIYVAAATQVNTQLQTASANYFPAFVSTNNAASSAMSVYTTSSFYINPASGNVTVGGALTVSSTAYNTATNTANAIYTPGAVYADKGLTVAGPVLFKDIVTFNGTATYVLSTNTYYTDNLIELHTPPGGVYAPWFVDDGKDIGFRFHYYTASTDTNAALVLDNSTKYLDWYSSGAEATNGDFSSATFGIFRTGNIKLVGGTANSTNTSSGDLTVLGGVGIGGSMYVGGNITVAGTINASITGVSTTATNIAGGTAGQLHYQSAPGITAFVGTGTAGNVLVSNGTGAPTYNNTLTLTGTTQSTSTTTGALQVAGGVGIGGNIYFNGNLYQNGVLFTSGSTSTTSTFTINNTTTSVSTTTGALVVQGGVGIGGSVNIGGTITGGGIRSTSTSTAPANATVGDIWYKTDTDDIYRYTNDGTTTTNYWLDITGPAFTSGTTVGSLSGGTAGQLLYQSAVNVTAFISTATSGNFLQGNFAGVPTWTSTGSMYVNRATIADSAISASAATNIAAGTTGQLVYQSGAGTTGFVGAGTFGQFLMSTGASAPVYQSTLTQAGGNIIITSNTAATSTTTGALQVVNGGVGIGGNLYVGGEIVATKLTIQLTTVTTTLVQTDDIIQTLNTTNATSTITGALQVAGGAGIGRDLWVGGNITVVGTITGVSTTATNIAAGTAGQLHYQSAPGTTAFVGTATTGNFLQANYVGAPTWTTTASMYVNDAVKSTNLRAGTAGQLHYQSAADTSGFINTATTGNFLQANYVGAPTWTTTASMYVNRATVADSVAAGGISGTIGNSQLTGSGAVTVTAGTGMGGGGSVALGSTVTLNATGTTINSTSSAYVLVAADAGKTISITTGGVTIPNAVMSAGHIVSIYNNSGSSQTITQGASLTLQWAGQSTSQTGSRTLGLYGMCTILFITASSAVITGSGLT